MKKFLLLGLWGAFTSITALEYNVQFENEKVHVAKVKILPHEEIGLHRDSLQQVVVGLKGGVVTRLEGDGSTIDVVFPTGEAVFREIDPPDAQHRSINNSEEPIELMIIQLK